ncbi:MAG: DNA alkylation repair protein [Clostridia bacterium]
MNKKFWNNEEYNKLVVYLESISDSKYLSFHKNLVPGINNILGIQIPKLRLIAKEIAKGNYMQYFKVAKYNYYEEIMLQGLVIGYIKEDYLVTLELIKSFVEHIDNWAICDSFCTKFKCIEKNKENFLIILKEYIQTKEEFKIRFAVVMFMTMYIDKNYIDEILSILNNISNEGYYVKMGVAWCLCECFIKFEDKTMKLLKDNNLDKFTYNKTLQKIVESFRISAETKQIIRGMKMI